MKKRFSAAFLFLFLMVFLALPAGAGTLDALPPWSDNDLYGVIHIDQPNAVLQRVVSSYLYRSAAAYAPEMEMLTGWLGNLPVTSLSLAAGQTEKGYSLQGAATFTEGKKDLLAKLAEGKGKEGDFEALVDSPMPGQLLLVPDQGSNYAVVADGIALFLLTVEKDMILFGFSPEDLAAAREALQNESKRMKVTRSLPQGSFFRFHDNGMVASEIQTDSMGALKAPVEPLEAEVGYEMTEKGFNFSLFSNFAKVFGVAEPDGAVHPIPMEDLLLVGGGKPWFSAIGQSFFKKSHIQALRDSAAAGDEDAVEVVGLLDAAKQFGIDDDALISILKTVGVVLGGQTRAFENTLPGGYFYLSGKKEDVALLLPIIEMTAKESGMPFEALTLPGWTALYAIKDPVDFVMGIRDGTVVFGLLNPEGLSSAPELSASMKTLYERKDLYAFFNLDMAAVRSTLLSLLNPEGAMASLLLEMEIAEVLPWVLEGLKLTAEIDSINIQAAAADRADFSVFTTAPDPKEIEQMDVFAARWQELAPEEDYEEEESDDSEEEHEEPPVKNKF
ncbi:MAG: hypothetical protein GX791_01750 [Synergistaceae bacterium]|nr:hypothetical protein [Synergistaceae bacterium]